MKFSPLKALRLLLDILGFGILYILVVIGSILIILVCLVCRILSVILIKIQHGNVTLLKGVDCWFTFTTSNLENCLLCVIICEGTLDYPKIKTILQDNLVKRNSRLLDYIVSKYGYTFWRKEKDFNIDDHLVLHSNLDVTTKQELNDIARKLHAQPFKPKTSPWRFDLIPLNANFEKSNEKLQYSIAFTFNHALADGHSMIHAVMNAIGDTKPNLPEPKKFHIPFWYRFWLLLRSMPFIPWLVIRMLIIKNVNLFDGEIMTGHRLNCVSKNFPVATIKRIKNCAKTSFNIVLLSCILGGMRKYLLRTNVSLPPKVSLSTSYSLRKSNSEQTQLINYFYPYIIELPIAKELSSKDRLLATMDATASLTNVSWKYFFISASYFLSLPPHWIGKILFKYLTVTVYMGIGGDENRARNIFSNGSQITEMSVVICTNRPTGISFAAVTQGDTVHMSLNVDSSLVTGLEDLQMILNDMEYELQQLDNTIDKSYTPITTISERVLQSDISITKHSNRITPTMTN